MGKQGFNSIPKGLIQGLARAEIKQIERAGVEEVGRIRERDAQIAKAARENRN